MGEPGRCSEAEAAKSRMDGECFGAPRLGLVTSCKQEGICWIAENGIETVFWFRATEHATRPPGRGQLIWKDSWRQGCNRGSSLRWASSFSVPVFCVFSGEGTIGLAVVVDGGNHFPVRSSWPLKENRSLPARPSSHCSWPSLGLLSVVLHGSLCCSELWCSHSPRGSFEIRFASLRKTRRRCF